MLTDLFWMLHRFHRFQNLSAGGRLVHEDKVMRFLCVFIVLIVIAQYSFAAPIVRSSPLLSKRSKSDLNSRSSLLSPSKLSSSLMSTRGGTTPPTSNVVKTERNSLSRNLLATWAVFQVVITLLQSIIRLFPVAAQPFLQKNISPLQWAIYASWVLVMMYTEGYKAFHQKFCPMVVKRAFLLADHPNPFNLLLAGPYSMGLFSANRKRLIVSWAMVTGVIGLVVLVKRLDYPYRAIVDGGVVAGLSFGASSLLLQYVQALLGNLPNVDPCFPEPSKEA